MHFHLIDAGSDDIVYLVQREDGCIIIVEVSDHRHLRTVPRGANLRRDWALAAAKRADQALTTPALTATSAATRPMKVILKSSARFPLPEAGSAHVLPESKRGGMSMGGIRRVFVTRPKLPPED